MRHVCVSLDCKAKRKRKKTDSIGNLSELGVVLDCKLGFRFEAASSQGWGKLKKRMLCCVVCFYMPLRFHVVYYIVNAVQHVLWKLSVQ